MPAYRPSRFISASIEAELASSSASGMAFASNRYFLEGKILVTPKDEKALNDFLQGVFKRKDYETLFSTLEFFKFSKDTVTGIVGAISTIASLFSAVGTVFAAVETVDKALKFLGLADKGFDMEAAIQQIGADVKTIYHYLEQSEARDAYRAAEQVRNRLDRIRNAINTAAISPSPGNLEALARNLDELESLIDTMLGFHSNRIPLGASTYAGSQLRALMGTHYLRYADGSLLPADNGLATMVWDPGFYIDALAAGLRLTVEANATLEPLYRSTGHRRANVGTTVDKLKKFVAMWRSQIMVADPAACITPDGSVPLQFGLLVGAMCPVTGISSLTMYEQFPIREVYPGGLLASGVPDGWRTTADPNAVVRDALPMHHMRVRDLMRACGLPEFAALLAELEQFAMPPNPSESVYFVSSARSLAFGAQRWIRLPAPVPINIDLGPLRPFAAEPDKTYPATRHFTQGVKVVKLLLGRRTRQSLTRIGYQLRLGKQLVELTRWEAAPEGERQDIDWFPTQQLQRAFEYEGNVYDCVQNRVLTAAEEEEFDVNGYSSGGRRLLVNQRRGTIQFNLVVDFKALANDEVTSHLGEVTLTFLSPLDVNVVNAFVIDLDVIETHKSDGGPDETETMVVEGVGVAMVPSYLLAPPEFFSDHDDARQRMYKAQIESKLASTRLRSHLSDLPVAPDPSPKFAAVRNAATIARDAQNLAAAGQHPATRLAISRHLLRQ